MMCWGLWSARWATVHVQSGGSGPLCSHFRDHTRPRLPAPFLLPSFLLRGTPVQATSHAVATLAFPFCKGIQWLPKSTQPTALVALWVCLCLSSLSWGPTEFLAAPE